MRLNITSEKVSLEDLLELFRSSSNIKDVYLLCHQAGCPVYVVRDLDNMCHLLWHPSKDEKRDVLNVRVIDGIFKIVFAGAVQPFESLESLSKGMVAKHMLGDNPFDTNYLIYPDKVT